MAKSALTGVKAATLSTWPVLILKRNKDLKITAGYGCVDGGHNAGCDQLHYRPLGIFQDDQRNLAVVKILLLPCSP